MRVPEAQQQFRYVNPNNGGGRLHGMQVQTSQAMFGGSGAQALAEAGKNLRAFGARLADDVERWDRMVAEEAFVKRQKEETDFRLEQNKRQGRNALGARDGSSLGVSDASRQWASQTRNRFTSDMSRNQARLFGLLSDRADAQLFAWAGVKEQREEQVWKTSELEGRIEEGSNRAAAMYKLGDMDAFRSSQAEIQQAVREMGELQGWDEKATTQKSLNAMGEALMPIAQGLVADGNTGAATAFIKEHAPALGAKRVLSLQSAIKTEQRRQAAEARAAAREARINARLDLEQRTQDAVSSWKNGAHYDNPPSREDFTAVYGEKRGDLIWREMEGKRQLGQDLQDLRTMTPDEQAAFLEARKPVEGEGYAGRAENFQQLKIALAQDAKQREDDPAAYLAAFAPNVAEARQSMFKQMTPENVDAYARTLQSAQQARGISPRPDAPLPLLPETDVRKIAAKIAAAPDKEKELNRYREVFGRHWPALERQLSTGEKLPPDIAIVSAGMTGRPARLLLDAASAKDFTGAAKKTFGPDYKTMQTAVASELKDFVKTVIAQEGGANLAPKIQASTEKLATQYMYIDGMSAADAARKAAAEVVTERYTLKGTYRVPKTVNADLVDLGFQRMREYVAADAKNLHLPNMPGLTGDHAASRYAHQILRYGQLITNGDESGGVLFVHGIPVRRADGSLVRMTWEELQQNASNLGPLTPEMRQTLQEMME